MSPDTLHKMEKPEYIKSPKAGVWFDKTKRGLLPIVIEYLLNRRQEYKNQKAQLIIENKQDSLEYKNAERNENISKEAANSLYGVCGLQMSRYYSIDLAESITLAGQYLLKYGKSFFESLRYCVISGDTDSIMVELPDGADHITVMNKFHENLDKHLISTFGVEKVTTRFKYEKRFSKFIVVKKKNYVGRMIDDGGKPKDEIYAKGLEMIKKDTITFTRNILNKLVHHLLYEEHSVEFYDNFVKTHWDEIHDRPFTADEICISKKVSKPFEEYKSPPTHAKLMKKMGGNQDSYIGQDIQYIIINNLDKENKAIHISNYTGTFDKEWYWEKHVYPPMIRLLAVVFPEWKWDKYELSKVNNPARPKRRICRKAKVKMTVPADTNEDEDSD
jgi:DNA polymerase elongation subunit (family B)